MFVLIAAGVVTTAAARPPTPDGSKPIPAGRVPTFCTEAEYAAGASIDSPTYGYYWSDEADAWVRAPRCFPHWGYLMMSPSQLVRAGKAVTMTAIPTDGSNSGEYAPQTNSISWQYTGTVVNGCGSADLTCTVIPFQTATEEWQWAGFEVSMPRTFFIDDPGENCAGQHLCPGATTHAWGFAGVVPKDFKTEISGRVTRPKCSETTCELKGHPGVDVLAEGGPGGPLHAITDQQGDYSLLVKKGTWHVTPTFNGFAFDPSSLTVAVKGKERHVDFSTCADEDKARGKPPLCRVFQASNSAKPSESAVHIKYSGKYWAKKPGVAIHWNGGLIGGDPIGASGTFHGTLFEKFWPRHDGANPTSACYGSIVAEQSGFKRRVTVYGKAVGVTAFVDNQELFKVGDYLCESETNGAAKTKGVAIFKVYTSPVSLAIFRDGAYDGQPLPPPPENVCVDLVPERRGRVLISGTNIDDVKAVRKSGHCFE